jgi:hypothetical protein
MNTTKLKIATAALVLLAAVTVGAAGLLNPIRAADPQQTAQADPKSEPVNVQRALADVIANVRTNEKLYQDIEVLMRSTYDIGDRPPTEEREVVRQQVRTRFVSQGEWFRLEREGGGQDTRKRASMDRIRAFDGRTTRALEQKAVGNISAERLEDENFIRPHLLLSRYARLAVPFSVYLSGDKAIQAHPNGRWNANLKMEVSYQGNDTFNGLKCHKVLVKVIQVKSGEVHDTGEYWLAEDRNYLPVRHLAYTYRFSKDIPVGEGVVQKFREIKRGVWFPSEVEVTAFNKFKIQQNGRRELQWREPYTIERVDLDPKYDRAFFAKVDFPAGTAVYEVEKGEILRSWRQGAPEEPPAKEPAKTEVPALAKEIVKMKVVRVTNEKQELDRAEKTIEDKEKIGQLLALFPEVGTKKQPDAAVPGGGARGYGAAYRVWP